MYPVDFMLDTGAAVSLLNTQLWDRIKGSCNELAELHKQELVRDSELGERQLQFMAPQS